MPKGPSNINQMFMNDLLLELSRNQTQDGKWFITAEKIDEICQIGQKKSGTRDKARARFVMKLRELHNAQLEYDRTGKRYILANTPYFVVNVNLQLSSEMLTALSAGNIFVQQFLPHLTGSSTSFHKELEKIFDKKLFSEGRSLAESVTMSLPVARIDGAVFSAAQQAIREKRTVTFTYASPSSGTPKRHIKYSPWGVYFTDRSWYVWGALPGQKRGMPCKICRIKDIELGDDKAYFLPPPGQEPEKILRSLWCARPGAPKHDVLLSFTPPLAASIEEMVWPKDVTITKDAKSGEVFLKTRTPELHGVAFFVLAGAPHAAAVEPAELRRLVMALGQQVHEKQQVVDAYKNEDEFDEEAFDEDEWNEEELNEFMQALEASTPGFSVADDLESAGNVLSSPSSGDSAGSASDDTGRK